MQKKLKVLIICFVMLLTLISITSCDTNESNLYTITYETNGHGSQPQSLKDQNKLPDSLPQLTSTGYIFDGWYLDKDLTEKVNLGISITKNITLYAKWIHIKELTQTSISSYLDKLITDTDSFTPAWNKEDSTGEWNYLDGLFLNSFVNIYYDLCNTNMAKANTYKDFFLNYVDHYLSSDGRFINPKSNTEGYIAGDLASVAESKILFDAYELTKNTKYLNAIEFTASDLSSISLASGTPNFTQESNQIWLENIYMYAPFYARYAKSVMDSDIFDTIFDQYQYLRNHLYDSKTGLYYHGFDSTKSIFWSDSTTGCSSSFWLRSMGFYVASLADVIEYFPKGEQKTYLSSLLKEAIDNLLKYQDKETKMFYQIIDKGPISVEVDSNYLETLENKHYQINGNYVDATITNYLESSGSALISYAISKAANFGYLSSVYKKVGEEIFEGIYAHSFQDNSLKDICLTAELGTSTENYRDGSMAYYLAEKVGTDFAIGYGPFVMAFLEYQKNSFTNRPTPYLYSKTINEVKTSDLTNLYSTVGTVVAVYKEGYLISDNYGSILIYEGQGISPNVEIGDVLEVTGYTTSYNQSVQFTTGTTHKILDNVNVFYPTTDVKLEDLDDIASAIEIDPIYLELEGTIAISGDYTYITFENTNVVGSLLPSNELTSLINGDRITLKGYAVSVFLSSSGLKHYLQIVPVEAKKELTEIPDERIINLLTINDLHGYIMQDSNNLLGISNIAAKINSIRNENPYDDVVLFGNGDLFQGTAISNMTKGKAVLDAMNLMNFDAMGIGNHEFDWGIDYILQYFDNNFDNGEANFPLLNANIYLSKDNSLLSISNGNVLQYKIIVKQGLKICLISYIGDVINSIEASKTKDYYFNNNIASSVAEIAGSLKNSGACDLVFVNIHDGGADDASQYFVNTQLANLKTNDDRFVVDAVINGHTHTVYNSIISRNGANLPVIQAGSNGGYLGRITLTIDKNNKVTSVKNNVLNMSFFSDYDLDVEASVDISFSTLKIVNLCTAGATVNYTNQLQNWKASVGLAITGADVFLSNDGGIRSNGNIKSGKIITNADLYEISPFDNDIWLMQVKYTQTIERMINSEALFYGKKAGVNLTIGNTYTFAIESYVYLKYSQLTAIASKSDINTGLILRDFMIEDLAIRGKNNQTFDPFNNYQAVIGYQLANLELAFIDNFHLQALCL